MNNIIKKIFELNEISQKNIKNYTKKRFLFDEIKDLRTRHFKGIIGPRGCGKTILLKQLSNYFNNSIYISMDSLEDNFDLFEIVKILHTNYKIENFFIDEIHFSKDYKKFLKNIYDFLEINLYFTSSVSISMLDSSYDLSRRVKLYYLYPFSLREYLFFKKDILLKQINFNDIFNNNNLDYMKYEYLFEDYLKGGNYPISMEEPDVLSLLENILKKVIYSDVASFSNLGLNELSVIENMIKFIGKSHVENMSFSNIAKNLGITKYKAIKYIELLEKSFILNIVYPKGTNVLKEPKILIRLPYRLLFNDFENSLGYLKEDFFADMMKYSGLDFYYLKSKKGKKTPDFLVNYKNEKFVIEIGGKSKGREQFKGIEIKNKYVLTYPFVSNRDKKPLILLGFL